MRGITSTLVVLCLGGYLASIVELPQAWSDASETRIKVSDGWRRTASGWEWRDQWMRPARTLRRPPVAWQVHPAAIASLQLLISLLALFWADPPVRSAMLDHVQDA